MKNTKVVRQSNIELLRIFAMFMVLVLHANFIAIGKPNADIFSAEPIRFVSQHFIESLSIVAVNVFVLISGWFGIKASIKGFFSLIFQIFFFWGIIYYVLIIVGFAPLSLKQLAECCAFGNFDQFLKAYMCLYILSPVLNIYIRNASIDTQRNLLVAFYLFSSTYGFIGGGSLFFVSGYGPLSFIGLYLLAQFIKQVIQLENGVIYNIFRKKSLHDVFVYLTFALFLTIMNIMIYIGGLKSERLSGMMYAYLNPIVIIESLFLLLAFTKFNIGSVKSINSIAKSCLAVYLFHSIPQIRTLFINHIRVIFKESDFAVVYILVYLILIFLISVLLDKIRVFIWNLIVKIQK